MKLEVRNNNFESRIPKAFEEPIGTEFFLPYHLSLFLPIVIGISPYHINMAKIVLFYKNMPFWQLMIKV